MHVYRLRKHSQETAARTAAVASPRYITQHRLTARHRLSPSDQLLVQSSAAMDSIMAQSTFHIPAIFRIRASIMEIARLLGERRNLTKGLFSFIGVFVRLALCRKANDCPPRILVRDGIVRKRSVARRDGILDGRVEAFRYSLSHGTVRHHRSGCGRRGDGRGCGLLLRSKGVGRNRRERCDADNRGCGQHKNGSTRHDYLPF